MYAITAVTGNVGGHVARALLAAGRPVRAIVRSQSKAAEWAQAGAQVAVADFTDADALSAALAGTDGAFVMLPTELSGTDASHRAMADSIAQAVAASGVPHVAMLSSMGAGLAEGTGPIRWLYHLENRLRATGTVVTAVRSPHFQEKFALTLGSVTSEGIYPVMASTAELPIPMAATVDIGGAIAHFLQSSPQESQIVDLQAPSYTETDVAKVLAAKLSRDVRVVLVPREGWLTAFESTGLPTPIARELVEMYEADDDGLLQPTSNLTFVCTTALDVTVDRVLQAARPSGMPDDRPQ